jgi:hypothetical protein
MLTLLSVPAGVEAILRTDGKIMEISDELYTALCYLQRKRRLGGLSGLVLLLGRLSYGFMPIWCFIYLYSHIYQWHLNAVYPVVAGIALVNLAYATLVQVVVWNALRHMSITIDDVYDELKSNTHWYDNTRFYSDYSTYGYDDSHYYCESKANAPLPLPRT